MLPYTRRDSLFENKTSCFVVIGDTPSKEAPYEHRAYACWQRRSPGRGTINNRRRIPRHRKHLYDPGQC